MELVANNFTLSSTTVTGIPMKVVTVYENQVDFGRKQLSTASGERKRMALYCTLQCHLACMNNFFVILQTNFTSSIEFKQFICVTTSPAG